MVETQTSKKEAFLAPFQGITYPTYGGMIDLRRGEAVVALNNMSLPTSRQESWKYTRTAPITNKNWNSEHKANGAEIPTCPMPKLACHTLVFVNGKFDEGRSQIGPLQEGLTLHALSSTNDDRLAFLQSKTGILTENTDHFFTAMNNAFWTDGAVIRVKSNCQIELPIHLVHITCGEQKAAHVRHLIEVATSSEIKVIQSHFNSCETATLSNVVTEAWVAQNARLTIDKVQAEADQGVNIAREQVYQESDSMLQINTITATGGWVRNDIGVAVDGENCETNLFATYAPIGKEHVDNHTVVDHLKAHCESNETYKGIVSEKATCVFNGKVFVRQDAQKTNAFQQNANIVMDDTATMNSKPELEIYADDVKCSHGSTTGQFDEEAVFYLKSRGICESSARKMLVHAFVNDVIEQLDEDMQDYVGSLMRL